MPPKGRKKAPSSAAAVGYQHTDKVTAGTVVTAINKKQWIVGKPVGQGGFGVLYLATPADQPKAEPLYVLKLEPHSNGPLFCEMHFYLRCAKPEMITSWLQSKKMKCLGVPKYICHGSHQHNGENRFLVMERFGTDLQNLFVRAGKQFHKHTVYKVAVRMIDALEYIHSKDYVHADIKAANILLGRNNNDEVYLVDYGLAARYKLNDKHIEYKPDPKCCHNGTIEFTSRDAHDGVAPSRRGDVEILGYCLVQWLCSRLPWEDKLINKEYVKTQKNKALTDVPTFMKQCYGSDVPAEIEQYMNYVALMSYDVAPDYDYLKSLFSTWLRKSGKLSSGLDFSSGASSSASRTSLDEFSSSPPPQKRARKPPASAKNLKPDDIVTPRGKKTKMIDSLSDDIRSEPVKAKTKVKKAPESPSPRKRSKTKVQNDLESPSPVKKSKTKMKDAMDSFMSDDSLGVIPLSPETKVKVDNGGSLATKRRIQMVTNDVYSPPVKTKIVRRRRPCKNPVDVAIQTSPWLKQTIKRHKKTTLPK